MSNTKTNIIWQNAITRHKMHANENATKCQVVICNKNATTYPNGVFQSNGNLKFIFKLVNLFKIHLKFYEGTYSS